LSHSTHQIVLYKSDVIAYTANAKIMRFKRLIYITLVYANSIHIIVVFNKYL